MTTSRTAVLAALCVAMIAPAGCNKRQIVTRVDPDTTIDLDYRFSDDDARMTADTMITSCLQSGWIDEWMREHNGARPTVIIGTVKNDTSDYINTKLFTKQIERALINSGRVNIVAGRDERGEIRDERLAARDWSRPDTVKKAAFELGADFMLIGTVGENVQLSLDQKKRVQYYQVDLELVDIESNRKAWAEEQRVKKTAQIKP